MYCPDGFRRVHGDYRGNPDASICVYADRFVYNIWVDSGHHILLQNAIGPPQWPTEPSKGSRSLISNQYWCAYLCYCWLKQEFGFRNLKQELFNYLLTCFNLIHCNIVFSDGLRDGYGETVRRDGRTRQWTNRGAGKDTADGEACHPSRLTVSFNRLSSNRLV